MKITFTADTPTGDAHVSAAPFNTQEGDPKVVLTIRTDIDSVYAATLDGHPAIAIFLGGEDADELAATTPWVFGNLLVQNWLEAKKLAAGKAGKGD